MLTEEERTENARKSRRKWREANPEKATAARRKWQEANLEKARVATKKWRAKDSNNYKQALAATTKWRKANPEKVRAIRDKWEKDNPEKRRSFNQNRRAVKSRADAEKFLDIEIFDRDGWICGLCGDPIDSLLRHPDPKSVSLDHVIPITKGGSHTRDNMQASHLRCNLSKGNRNA